jgi:amino acid adenylation domain-containing protein
MQTDDLRSQQLNRQKSDRSTKTINRTDYPRDLCIHQLFENQVEKTPNAIAVIFQEQQLTYRELNRKANQLAKYLQNLGVGSETLVGICLERSVETIVSLIATLKAGGVYVPLDPSYPPERLDFMQKDAGLSVLLTKKHWLKLLPLGCSEIICLDADWKKFDRQSQENPIASVKSNNLAYVIYTSGSTGKPKGVEIAHRSVCNELSWRQTQFPLTTEDRLLQTVSISFDPSVWQIFWPLCFGAQLILAKPEGDRDLDYLINTIARDKITVINFVPSMLRLFLETENLEGCKGLKHVTCGGEALPIELVNRFVDRLGLENVLHNFYGPTETTIDATYWVCQHDTNYNSAPIGRPIANTQIYLLNEQLQLVALGDIGEIYIGGDCLARGYRNRPELTAEKFIQNPFDKNPSTRVYHTGDLGRYLADGNLEFVGRVDRQVKIRGFRVELGEIERRLCQHPDIEQAIVTEKVSISGNKMLVAYFTSTRIRLAKEAELRKFLAEKLPEFMIPNAFVCLESFPLNPNGKIDFHALPFPSLTSTQETFIAPRNELESKLAQIWSQVLGINNISVTDDFLNLGGNSLIAVSIFAKIETRLGKKLPLASLFQAPTIEGIAKFLQQPQTSISWSSLVPIQIKGNKPPFFCVHAVGGNVLSYLKLGDRLGADRPVYGLQVRGLDGKSELYTTIEDIAAHYVKEIQTIQPEGSYFLGGHSFGGYVALEMAQQLHKQGKQVAIVTLFDCIVPDLASQINLSDRLYFHLKNMRELDRKTRLAYFWLRVWWLLSDLIPKFIAQAVTNFSDRFRSPQDLLNRQIEKTNIQALEQYLPKMSTYPGKIALFRAKVGAIESYVELGAGWKKLALGGLEVHEIPGDHTSFLLKEANLNIFARKLKNCLDEAQNI